MYVAAVKKTQLPALEEDFHHQKDAVSLYTFFALGGSFQLLLILTANLAHHRKQPYLVIS